MKDDELTELKQLREHLFGPPNPNPHNAGRITLDQVIEFSTAWQRSRGRTDADMITDGDGNPVSVGESYPIQCAGLAIRQSDADRLGITPAQYPGILIIPDPRRGTTTP